MTLKQTHQTYNLMSDYYKSKGIDLNFITYGITVDDMIYALADTITESDFNKLPEDIKDNLLYECRYRLELDWIEATKRVAKKYLQEVYEHEKSRRKAETESR